MKLGTTRDGDAAPRNPQLSQIIALWDKILPRLRAGDPMGALAEWGRAPERLRPCLTARVEDWLVDQLAVPQSCERPWRDTQGLARLIYRHWRDDVPCRMFTMDILPDVMAYMISDRGDEC